MDRREAFRLNIEAGLSDAELDALRGACDALGVPAERWPQIPMLRDLYETLAARRFEARLVARGWAERDARVASAKHVALKPKTLLMRLQRIRRRLQIVA
jgi:hypothetical protein